MILQKPALGRRLAAEAVGTGILAMVVIGSGIQAAALTQDGAVRFLANVLASVCALGVLIALLGPVSGAHLNPLLSAGVWWTGRGRPDALPGRELAGYALAQAAGGIGGAVLANAMFRRPAVGLSHHVRSGGALWTSEAVATGVLFLLVFGLARGGRDRYAPMAVAGWISAACWGTASGSFANPALTLARAFSDSYTGIAPGSVPGFVLAQLIGAVAGLGLVAVLFGAQRPAPPRAEPATAGPVGVQPAPAPVRGPVAELLRKPRLSRV